MIFLRDLRYGARALMQTPAFTIVAVTALALGIGANATVFSVGNYLVLKPLPAHDPQSLTRVYTSRGTNTTYPDFVAYRDGNHSFVAIAAAQLQPVSIRAGGEPEGAWAEVVSGEYFSVLGIPAAAGRTIRPDEGQTAGSAPVAVISHGYWARRFASDPAAVGRQISINGIPFTVVGVMPRTFAGALQPLAANLWIPVTMEPLLRPGSERLTSRGLAGLHIVGRLKDGVSVAEAQADLSVIAADLARSFPDTTDTVRSRCTARRFCRRSCARPRARSSGFCWQSPRWCCSSRAPTSRTCCSRVCRHGAARSPCDRRWARDAVGW
jgi:hypothetical protein